MPRTPYWTDVRIVEDTANGFGDLVDLLPNLDREEKRGITVVRQIIELALTPVVTSGVVGTMLMDIGIGVASSDAFGAGSSALPNPGLGSSRPARGWLFRTQVAIIDDADNIAPPTRVHEDVRTKRKVDDGDLFMQIEALLRTGTAFDVKTTGLIRTLYLLP